MNKTKKITQGAMLLAILGAVMLIDRYLSGFFSELIVLAVPIVIIIYSTMNNIKDGVVLSVCLVVITLLCGTLVMLAYLPVTIIVGVGLSVAIKNNCDRRRLSFIAILLYVFGELLATFIVGPIMGIDFVTRINETKDLMNQAGMMEMVNMVISDVSSFFVVLFCFSIIVTGILEGFLTSFVTAILLKRLKIKDIGFSSLMDLKLSPVLAYVLFIVATITYIQPIATRLDSINHIFYYIVMCISIFASTILMYYGYIYFVIYCRISFGNKSTIILLLIIFFLLPLSLLILLIAGFLYGSGPLRRSLERKIYNKQG